MLLIELTHPLNANKPIASAKPMIFLKEASYVISSFEVPLFSTIADTG